MQPNADESKKVTVLTDGQPDAKAQATHEKPFPKFLAAAIAAMALTGHQSAAAHIALLTAVVYALAFARDVERQWRAR